MRLNEKEINTDLHPTEYEILEEINTLIKDFGEAPKLSYDMLRDLNYILGRVNKLRETLTWRYLRLSKQGFEDESFTV